MSTLWTCAFWARRRWPGVSVPSRIKWEHSDFSRKLKELHTDCKLSNRWLQLLPTSLAHTFTANMFPINFLSAGWACSCSKMYNWEPQSHRITHNLQDQSAGQFVVQPGYVLCLRWFNLMAPVRWMQQCCSCCHRFSKGGSQKMHVTLYFFRCFDDKNRHMHIKTYGRSLEHILMVKSPLFFRKLLFLARGMTLKIVSNVDGK